MADMLYISFLNRLFKHCKKRNGRIDIRHLVTDRLSYDTCFTFMLWAEQDDICTISVMFDYIIIYLTPEVFMMSRTDYYKLLGNKFNIKHDRRKTT